MIPYEKQNATKHYLTHFSNRMFLDRVSKAPKDFKEKLQAEKEIKVADRKMDHWKKHMNYDHAAALAGVAEIKKQ